MKKIRFLQAFVTNQRVSFSGPDLIFGERERRELIILPEESKFYSGEELEVQPLTIGEERHILIGNLDQRLGAILDDAVEGKDFEVILH